MNLPAELFVQPVDTTLTQLFYDHGGVIPHTTMFRDDARLEQVLELGLESYRDNPEPGQLSVISAGSSIGAEAYSVLAYLNAAAPDVGRVGLTGLDINPILVREAQRGRYRAVPFMHRLGVLTKDLVELNFTVAPHDVQRETLVIGTEGLSDNNDVRFMVHDMRESSEEVPEADIILCNNVLFHLSPGDAEAVLLNMADRLKPGGVMSIGANPKQVSMNSNSPEGYNFSKWRVEMGEKLAGLGVSTLLFNVKRRAPFVFRKDR